VEMQATRDADSRIHMKRLAALSALLVACAPPQAVIVSTVPVPAPAPVITVEQPMPVDQVIIPTRPVTPLQGSVVKVNRITMTATNADVRELLPALASAAGVSLVMASDVRGRVSVNLRDVPAIDALRAVIEEAGLTTGTSELTQPFSPVVFYNLPVNVNTASAATIKARYAVTDSVANWIVRARNW
jgi:hypothetical protein